MRLVLISDTHTMLDRILLPEGDILIHSGDATFQGTIPELSEFNYHLSLIKDKYKHIIFVPGNHDWLFETNESLARDVISNATVLIDQSITIDGIKFYGSPHQPEFCNWAFNLPRGEPLKQIWSKIPDDTNVLITHGPPMDILDRVGKQRKLGCQDLKNRITELNDLKLHVFGHIHDGYGVLKNGNTTFVNASICNEQYRPVNEPIIIDI